MASQPTSNHTKWRYAGVQPVIDQAARYGLHKIVRKLGMPLLQPDLNLSR